MPQMADIIVKKDDGTTNITYTALNPSGGDKVAATWSSKSVSTIAGHRPAFSFKTERSGGGDRRVRASYYYPYVVLDAAGNPQKVSAVPLEYSGLVPLNVPDAVVAEAVSQCANLLASALIKEATKAGYAPT